MIYKTFWTVEFSLIIANMVNTYNILEAVRTRHNCSKSYIYYGYFEYTLEVSFSDNHFKCSVILLTAAEHIILLWKSKQKASENTRYKPQWLHLVLLRRVGRIVQKYFLVRNSKIWGFFILFLVKSVSIFTLQISESI